jgi:hypothetical protein
MLHLQAAKIDGAGVLSRCFLSDTQHLCYSYSRHSDLGRKVMHMAFRGAIVNCPWSRNTSGLKHKLQRRAFLNILTISCITDNPGAYILRESRILCSSPHPRRRWHLGMMKFMVVSQNPSTQRSTYACSKVYSLPLVDWTSDSQVPFPWLNSLSCGTLEEWRLTLTLWTRSQRINSINHCEVYKSMSYIRKEVRLYLIEKTRAYFSRSLSRYLL